MGPTGRLVTIKRSGDDGAHFPLSLSTCLFGRDIECDIRIQLPVVSKQHCKIEVKEQKAILYNFSSTNPTQVNGSVIDEPVQLKHGDVITIIDRSFRYENQSHRNGSKSTEVPGKICEQEPAQRASRASFSADPDVKGQDSKAHSKVTSRRSLAHIKNLNGDSATSVGSKDSVVQGPPDARSPEHVGHNSRNEVEPTSGGLKEKSRVTVSCYRELKSSPSTQSLDNGKKNESPFKKLYQSMKEELGIKLQRQSVLQYCRKSGSQLDSTTEKERKEKQLLVSQKSRSKSDGSAQVKAASSAFELESSQTEAKGNGVEPVHTSQEAMSSSISLPEPTKTKTPVRYSQQHKDEDPHVMEEREPANLGESEGISTAKKIVTPGKLLTRKQTPAKVEDAANHKPENLSLENMSTPTNAEVLPTETKNRSFLTPCLAQVEKNIRKAAFTKPEKLATTAEQICSELPGLSSVDISNFDDSINKSEGTSLKRRRVSFGGHLRPELFDENLPPNTPLKRGETPTKRKSLVTHTSTVLKKIIKEQPQSGKEESSQSMCTDVPAPNPGITPPGASNQRRRSGKASPDSGASKSLQETDIPKKAGRKSSSLTSKRASISRSQHDILQMICSRRRSGASEANLIVAKSWADVVKLGVKQTQTKVVKQGPQRQVNKRQRRPNTPKKPAANNHNQFSTGHANSPCTIVIGKAQIEKVNVPARPYRMLNNFVFNQKIVYNEDLSGLSEMFKTPVKEKPQRTSTCSVTISNSENLLEKQFQVTNSGESPQPLTSEIQGQNVSSSVENAIKEPVDKYSGSPTLRRQSIKGGDTVKTPRNVTHLGRETVDTMTEPLKTVSSANGFRRSRELRDTQTPAVESKNEGTEAFLAEGIIGRHLRKTPLRGQEAGGEAQGSERSLETFMEDVKSKGNLEKMTPVRKSKTEKQKRDSIKDLSPVLPHTPVHTKEPVNEEEKNIKMSGKSSQPELADPSKSRKRQLKTPTSDDKGIKVFKGASKQKVNPVVDATEMKRRTRAPKEETQLLEDLTGFKELFQTPNRINKPMSDHKTKVTGKSPQPAAVDTPSSMKSQPNTSQRRVGVKDELSAQMSEETTYTPRVPEGNVVSIGALKESEKRTLRAAENVTSSKRQRGAPKEKAQPLKDFSGFQELFQTPGHATDPMTVDKTTKVPWESPQPATIRTSKSMQRRSKTSLGNMDIKEELSAFSKLRQSPGKTMHRPTEPEQEEAIKIISESPKQKLDLSANLTGLKRWPQMPKENSQSLQDLSGFQELFQTPDQAMDPVIVGETTEMCQKSPQPRPVRTPGGVKRQSKRSLEKVHVTEELSGLWKLPQTSGEIMHTPQGPEGNDEGIRLVMQPAKRKLDPAENVTVSKRIRRAPKEKAQPLEDLAGFQELFQTPSHAKAPVTMDKTTKIPCKTPQPAAIRTPTSRQRRSKTSLGNADVKEELSALRKRRQSPGNTVLTPTVPVQEEAIKAFMQSPEQKLDLTENLTGLKRQPQTSKERSQSLEVLSGFQELFQTPNHTMDTRTVGETTEMPQKSPQPGPVRTPTSRQRRSKISLGIADVKKELSALRKQRQSLDKAVYTSTMPEQEEDNKTFMQTPKQKLYLTENLTGLRRQPQTSKERSQSLEDLSGFQELFQTPNHTMDTRTVGETTEMPQKSPQPGPVRTPTSRQRQSKISLRNADVKEELLTLRKQRQSLDKAVYTSTMPEQEEDNKAFMQTPKLKLDLTENLTGLKRQPQTSKERSQSLEDLSGFQELFQTPNHSMDTRTVGETTEMPQKSPQPGPVRTPTSRQRRSKKSLRNADVKELSTLRKQRQTLEKTVHTPIIPGQEEAFKTLMETPRQELDLAENLTGLKRWPQTPKERSQWLEDLTGLQELFQTPNNSKDIASDDKTTNMCWKSPQLGLVRTPTGIKRLSRTSLGKVDVKEELSSQSKPRRSSEATKHTPKVPESGVEGIEALKDWAQQTLHPAASVTGSRKWSRTKEGSQILEDPAGFQELFQALGHSENPMPMDRTTRMPCRSPQPGAMDIATTLKRRSRTSLGKVNVKEEPSALRELMKMSGETTHRAAEDDVIVTRALKESAKQTLNPAASVTGNKRKRGTPKEKAQPLEDLAGLQELFQTPGSAKDTMPIDRTTKMPLESPQPEPMDTPTTSKRQPRASLAKLNVKELSGFWKLPQMSGEATHTSQVPEGEDKVIREVKKSAKRKLDQAPSVTTNKRLRRAAKEKAQPLEDLEGLQELFQTPGRDKDPVTFDRTTKLPHKSPQTEPVDTSATLKRQPRMRRGKVDVEEELPAARKLTRASRQIMLTHKVPEGDVADNLASKESAKQTLDPAPSVRGSRRLRGASKEKAQPPLEDLDGFQELFLVIPGHDKDPLTIDRTTKLPCRSPQQEAVDIPATLKRQPRTRLRKVNMEEELPAVRKLTRASRQTTRNHKVPEGDVADNLASKESAKQTLNPAPSVPGSRRLRGAAKEPLEDLASSKELFQTPDHTRDSASDEKATKMPYKSPQPEPDSTTLKRQLRTRLRKAVVKEESSAQGMLSGTSGEARKTHKEPVGNSTSIQVLKESAKRKLDPAARVNVVSKRLRGSSKENAQPLKDLADSQTPGHTEDSVPDGKTAKLLCKSPQPEVETLATSKRQPRARLGKVNVEEEMLAVRKLTRTSRHTHKVPESDIIGSQALKEPAKQTLEPEPGVTGSRRRTRAPKAERQPPEYLAGSKEVIQTPDHAEELIKGAQSTPQPTPDTAKPLKTSRRVLRASKEKPVEDLVGTRDPDTSQSKSNASLSPKRKSGKDGSRGPPSMTPPQEAAEKRPVCRKQRAAPSKKHTSAEPLNTVRPVRITTPMNEPTEEQDSNSVNTEKGEPTVEEAVTPSQRKSLRTRRQNKTDVEQQRPEEFTSAEKNQVRRNERSVKTSQETEAQNPGDTAKKPAARSRFTGDRMCLRAGRQSKVSQPLPAEEKVRGKSMEIPVKEQKENRVAGKSGVTYLRSRKTGIQSRGDTLDSEPEPRITRGAKRGAENPKKDKDIAFTKKVRTRSQRNSEAI
nr:proliferation marker protein Ki-67 [Castor canadensis]